MDEKFSGLTVRVNQNRPAASGKFIDVNATAPVKYLFKLTGDDAGEFDIAFARSLVSPHAVAIGIESVDGLLFTARQTDPRSHAWKLEYHPTDAFPLADGQDHPETLVNGKPENRYDSDEVRMFAKNVLVTGMRAFGIYTPRQAAPKAEKVVVPPEIQAALDGLTDDMKAVVLALTARGLQAQARSERLAKARDAKKTAAVNAVAVAAKPLGKVHTTINVPK